MPLYKTNYLHFLLKSVNNKRSLSVKFHKAFLPGVKKILFCFISVLFIFCFCQHLVAQPTNALYSKDCKAENRARLYKNLVNNAITKNLTYPLSDSTEENWMDAFNAMELIRYQSPWTESRIHEAFVGIEKRSVYFQQALMELVYAAYQNRFLKEVKLLINLPGNDKVFAMCAEYIQPSANMVLKKDIAARTIIKLVADTNSAILKQLNFRLNAAKNKSLPPLNDMLQQSFFKNAKLVFSFQRKNRDYPGIAIVRDSAGNFVKDEYGSIFFVPQLARSMSSLPGYLSNGNTPQGIFRMKGLDTSKSNFIGPTPNIQLTMPGETSLQHFMNDSSIVDSVWTERWYSKLLPESWSNYFPFYETYFAGKAGRTDIIAHGTTINPEYYKGQPYYPLTPTLGCLCTKEIWSETDGKRTASDQQKLVDALQRAGGADGYYIVIEIDDSQKPVNVNELLPLLNNKK